MGCFVEATLLVKRTAIYERPNRCSEPLIGNFWGKNKKHRKRKIRKKILSFLQAMVVKVGESLGLTCGMRPDVAEPLASRRAGVRRFW